MNNQIEVYIRHVFNQDRIYPACEVSRLFTKLLDKKTLMAKHLGIIRELGFEVKFVTPPKPSVVGKLI